jgi:hypothetical protein
VPHGIDQAVCVQLADAWARLSIICPAPFSASTDIKHLLVRAARMIIAAVGVIELDTADLGIELAGYDMCQSDELQDQIAEEWLRALIEAVRHAQAAKPMSVSDAPEPRKSPPAQDPVAPPCATAAEPQPSTDAPGADRRAKLIKTMVRTVRQYAQAYGSAPDFSSDKPLIVSRVHNFIRSVTSQRQTPLNVLESVRLELAKTQNAKLP